MAVLKSPSQSTTLMRCSSQSFPSPTVATDFSKSASRVNQAIQSLLDPGSPYPPRHRFRHRPWRLQQGPAIWDSQKQRAGLDWARWRLPPRYRLSCAGQTAPPALPSLLQAPEKSLSGNPESAQRTSSRFPHNRARHWEHECCNRSRIETPPSQLRAITHSLHKISLSMLHSAARGRITPGFSCYKRNSL